MQRQTTADDTKMSTSQASAGNPASEKQVRKGLRSTSLLYNTRYEKMAEMVGGRGWFVRTEEELANATREAFLEKERVCVLNVIIDPGLESAAQFGWMERKEKDGGIGAGGDVGSKL